MGSTSVSTAPAERESPYQGLQPFTEADRKYFFGREQDTETILANLLTSPLTVLYGASGVGKSSVLLAGVVPRLREMQDVTVVTFRTWQHADITLALNRALLEAVESPPRLDPNLPLETFLVQFERATMRPVVFIFDQFEEYFLYHDDDTEAFEAGLARAINGTDIEANFIFSLREDGLSKLDRFRRRIPNLLGNLLRLEHLTAAAAESAIRRPLDVYNASRPAEPPLSIEKELVQDVLRQVQTGKFAIGRNAGMGSASTGRLAAETRVETPFLQMVLLRLWDEERRGGSRVLRRSTLEALGGAQSIVRTHLDRAMGSLSADVQGSAAAVFHYLVTPSGSKVAYTAEDLAAYAGMSTDKLTPMLDGLCQQDLRILRRVSQPPELRQQDRYEIYHDVLAAAVLDWRLRHRANCDLAEQIKSERALLHTAFTWKPWLFGYAVSLISCGLLPIGAFVTRWLLMRRSPEFLKPAIRRATTVWLVAWVPFTVVYLVMWDLVHGWLHPEHFNEVTEENLLVSYILLTWMLARTTLEPVLAMIVFRRAVKRAVPELSSSRAPRARASDYSSGVA